MARNQAVSIVLVLVLVLAISFAPLASAVAQSELVTYTNHEVYNQISVGVAIQGAIACEGCSAGGGGPA